MIDTMRLSTFQVGGAGSSGDEHGRLLGAPRAGMPPRRQPA